MLLGVLLLIDCHSLSILDNSLMLTCRNRAHFVSTGVLLRSSVSSASKLSEQPRKAEQCRVQSTSWSILVYLTRGGKKIQDLDPK